MSHFEYVYNNLWFNINLYELWFWRFAVPIALTLAVIK